ncbi:hypothetical protein NDU88_006292 [Pleurodeles waltl]|uniref:Uncharacterized protein n=1 Tax=Pleurodeles waltl TaxID=8319 RepID=A0AAV7X3A8_PLEWA|nr:hypothetical protein NDU88_006292 [Pleurodeles waltl]
MATGEDTLTVSEKARASLVMHIATNLEAIRDTKVTLEAQIAVVVNEVGLLHEDHKKLVVQVKLGTV